MQEGTPWCSQCWRCFIHCAEHSAEGAQFWLAPSPEHAGFSICGCRWACSSWHRLCLSVCRVWTSTSTWAEKCVEGGRDQLGSYSGDCCSRAMYTQPWQTSPYVCDHHVTPLIYFLFFFCLPINKTLTFFLNVSISLLKCLSQSLSSFWYFPFLIYKYNTNIHK